MVLLSGEVETPLRNFPAPAAAPAFRMVLLSGEVETSPSRSSRRRWRKPGSGWFCYPGKLKPGAGGGHCPRQQFRMVLLSGEVETRSSLGPSQRSRWVPDGFAIRGKLKRDKLADHAPGVFHGSGLLCYPGKLKQLSRAPAAGSTGERSGWFCYPGKLKSHP